MTMRAEKSTGNWSEQSESELQVYQEVPNKNWKDNRELKIEWTQPKSLKQKCKTKVTQEKK